MPGADPSPPPPVFPADPTSLDEAGDRPRRVLGLRDLVLFYVVTGISLRWIATAAAAGPSSIVIWLGAWLTFYTPLALSVIELSSRYPNEGGLYVWSKRAFGPFSGFMAAWSYWSSDLPYFPAVLYFAASNTLYIFPGARQQFGGSSAFYIYFALATLAAATLLNLVGLDIGKWLNNVGAVAMWIPVGIVIVLGLVAWQRFGSATHFTFAAIKPSTHLKDIIFWSTLTFAFGGCETASFMGEEIKNARRNIPLALFSAGVTVAFCYIIGTVCILLALPPSQVNGLEGLMQAISATTQRVGFGGIIPVAAFLIALSNVGAAGAYLAATSRLPFVAGIDKFLPSAFGKLHPRWKTPWVAILTQSVLGAIFIFLGQAGTSVKGAYDVLVSMGVITYFIPYLYVFASMIRLQREPAGPDVIRVPGGKPVAYLISIVGFATTAAAIALSLLPPPDEPNQALAILKVAGGSLVIIVLGAGLYRVGKKRLTKTR